MLFKKVPVVACLLFSLVIGLCAEQYPVTTENPAVTCSLETLSEEQTLNFFGNFGYFLTQHLNVKQSGPLTISKTSYPKLINVFKDASKKFMVVKVNVENNTDSDIILTKDHYLQNLGNCYQAKDILATEVYNKFNSGATHLLIGSAAGTIIGLLGTIFATWNLFSGFKIWKLLTTPVPAAATGGAGLLSYYLWKKINEASEKSSEIMNYATHSMKTADPNIIVDYPGYTQEEELLLVPAGHLFRDFFLVDVTKCPRNIIENLRPTLDYAIND